jgi:hypothetical protein
MEAGKIIVNNRLWFWGLRRCGLEPAACPAFGAFPNYREWQRIFVNVALPFLAGKKTMNYFFATDYTDFHRFFLLKSAQIREIRGCGFCFPVKNGRTVNI